MSSTAERVLDALAAYDLKSEGNGQYRANNPLYGIIGCNKKRSRQMLETSERLLITDEGEIFMVTSSEYTPSKCCTKCGNEYPLSNYNKNKATADGLMPFCRSCHNQTVSEWRTAHPERARQMKTDTVARTKARNLSRSPYDEVATKRCHTCGIEKASSAFYLKAEYANGLDYNCKDCSRQYARAWSSNHAETEKARRERYSAQNREAMRQRERERYWNDPEKYRNKSRVYQAIHREQLRIDARIYSSSHRQARREYGLRYRQTDQGKLIHCINSHIYRARARGTDTTFTAEEIKSLRKGQADHCWYCGVDLHGGGHIDHFIPLARGGRNDIGNLRLSCESCNLHKHARDPIEFGRLL